MTERPDQPQDQQTPEPEYWPLSSGTDTPDGTGAAAAPDPRRLIVTVFAVLVVLVGVGVGIAAWAGAFGDDDSSGSGGSVVTAADGTDEQQIQSRIEALATAYNDKDVTGFAENFCSMQRVQLEQLIETTEATAEEIFPGDSVSIEGIEDITIEGDEAIAEVEMTMTEEGAEDFSGVEVHQLVREDGDWLICG